MFGRLAQHVNWQVLCEGALFSATLLLVWDPVFLAILAQHSKRLSVVHMDSLWTCLGRAARTGSSALR